MISGVMGFLIILEIVRCELHLVRPYESHTKTSGMAKAVPLEGKALDAAAVLTYQYGFCSMVLIFGYSIPFVFGDPDDKIKIYMISATWFSRTLQLIGMKRKLWAPVQTP